ncbi:acVLRF1 family peptidyl-tRNA hydrolase [Nocardioides bruguierae]|uniref:Actinobacteria/chloroflexi VLRF1 release factor domain-containing protein n=1 Tax=Nocardioides bruguierae TaxID=2945102 RepID=A0A9X2D4I5_9ACTN|nr:acVLRF1 family peptidyl-tRNA hydrolase [Nocardioides bruguierae]MCM0618920.1 hypothetical protein [Nocardioides bruguierae]
MPTDGATTLLLPAQRLPRWLENFARRHGDPAFDLDAGVLVGRAPDGAWCRVALPGGHEATAPDAADVAAQAGALARADRGVLLVRRGGFAVALVRDGAVVASKVGQRHVQGRTKAGGWSQQRFARRRDAQARVAGEAAAGHAARVLDGLVGPLVTGGDRAIVGEVLEDLRLGSAHPDAAVAGVVVDERFLDVPDPRRDVLDRAVVDAAALQVVVHNG